MVWSPKSLFSRIFCHFDLKSVLRFLVKSGVFLHKNPTFFQNLDLSDPEELDNKLGTQDYLRNQCDRSL